MTLTEARRFGLAMSRGYLYVDETVDWDRALEGMVVRQVSGDAVWRGGKMVNIRTGSRETTR